METKGDAIKKTYFFETLFIGIVLTWIPRLAVETGSAESLDQRNKTFIAVAEKVSSAVVEILTEKDINAQQ